MFLDVRLAKQSPPAAAVSLKGAARHIPSVHLAGIISR
jgi:hypothetical protein